MTNYRVETNGLQFDNDWPARCVPAVGREAEEASATNLRADGRRFGAGGDGFACDVQHQRTYQALEILFVETSRGHRRPSPACSRGRCAARRCRSPTTRAARARIPQDRSLCLSVAGTPPGSVGNHVFSGFGAEARPAIRRNPSGRPGRSG
jgi:hypothetical protein